MTSPLSAALARVGDRWTLLVVEALFAGPARFNQLQDAVPGIATNVLSQRLKHLEQEGLVAPEAYTQRPPRYAYRLTAVGHELADALRLLAAWGSAHDHDSESPAHTMCGTALQPRWYCPTCTTVVEDPEADDLRYA